MERPDLRPWRAALDRVRRARRQPYYMPGLLLVVLDLIHEGAASPAFVGYTPELRSRFDRLLKATGETQPQVRMPFNYLASSSQVWRLRKGAVYVEAFNPPPSSLERVVDGAEFNLELQPALGSLEGREAIRDMILRMLDAHPGSEAFAAVADPDYPVLVARQRELLARLDEPFHATIVRERYSSNRELLVRSRAFAREVLAQYDFQCGLCRSSIRFAGMAEVEAAHIWPVAEGGSDDLRNALTLCRTHHWCFDQLLWTVDVGGRVQVALEVLESDRLAPLRPLHGATLVTPRDLRAAPHEAAFERHRAAWESAGRMPM